MTSQQTSRRLTVQEAAEVLGTSVDAVRMRVRRGSLDSEKEPDGRVYVYLDDDLSETRPRPDSEPTVLISAKDETIAVLKEQLEAEREAHREARRIIAGLVQRVPQLEAPAQESPPEARESTESSGPNRTTPTNNAGDAQTATQRPWWRRIIGG